MQAQKPKQKKRKRKEIIRKNSDDEEFENAIKVDKEQVPKMVMSDSDEDFFY